MSSNRDLRKYQDSDTIANAFGALVSGKKSGYKTVIERKKPSPKCIKCNRLGKEEEKFCTECGGKMIIPITNCPGCKRFIEESDKFCPDCGYKLKDIPR